MSRSDKKPELKAVIMCGGSGTRFWPASRRDSPKQFLRLLGQSSLIQESVARLAPLVPLERIYLLAAAEHREALRSHLPEVPEENYILEPSARNTAPALALAARILGEESPEAVLAALPADHSIADAAAFLRCLETAAAAASAEGTIACIGIKPDSPETGYGYIEVGDDLGDDGALRVIQFVEKPDIDRAREYVAGGRHYWNAGIFLMRADTLEAEFRRQQPEIHEALWERLPKSGDDGFAARLAEVYPNLPKISIDYAVMEGAQGLVCVPGDFGWNDLGSWKALEKLWSADEHGNHGLGRYHSLDSRGNIVSAKNREIALIGVEDLVVVERDDVVLVCSKDRCQDVRALVELLKRGGREDLI